MSAPQQTLPIAAAPVSAEAQIAEWSPPKEWSDGWRNLVLDLVDPERHLTDLETAYFFARAAKLGLDPLARQIFPVKLQGRMEPFVGIHGIRMLAERTGEREGEMVTARTYDMQEKLTSVEVTVKRRGHAYVFTARMDEFAPKVVVEKSSWQTKPEVMLTKCAAANCYRMAFPEVLGGLYIPEEVE
jgi:phage recombination protein Bet